MTKPKTKQKAALFLHCQKCLQDLPIKGQSPQTYARLSVGVTPDGRVEVWCNRHDMQVGPLLQTDLQHFEHCTCSECGGETETETKPCRQHRSDGRGFCIDCGNAIH